MRLRRRRWWWWWLRGFAVVVYVYSNDETLCLIIGSTLKCIRNGVARYEVRVLQYWRHIHSSPRFLSGALAMVQNVELRSWSPCCRCLTFMWTQATITRWCTYDRTTRNQPNLTKPNRTKPEPEPEIQEIPAIVVGKQAKSTRSSHESYDAYVYFWHLACQIQ